MRRRARSLAAVAMVMVGGAAGCVDYGSLGGGDAVGQNGKVVFSTETNLVFSTRLAVGSNFPVSFTAKSDKDAKAVANAALEPDNQDILDVDDAQRVHIVGPGTGELRVVGEGGVIDFLPIHAGFAGATTLVDTALLATTDSVDARLPQAFAAEKGVDLGLAVAAIDRCGAELLDLHASTLEADGDAEITEGGPAAIVLHPNAAADLTLTLKTPGLDDLAYDVRAVDRADIDEVQVGVSAVSNDGVATVWGRAFSNDVELAGAQPFSWSADERVTLSSTTGAVVAATVSFAAAGQPPDDRPAGVSAEIFGESGAVDLLASTTTTTTSRGTPARELEPADSNPGGCGGGDKPCDPEAAAAIVGLGFLAPLRRRLARLGLPGRRDP